MDSSAGARARRLIVPAVLAISTIAGAAAAIGALSTTAGCKAHKPVVDAGHDAPADIPVV